MIIYGWQVVVTMTKKVVACEQCGHDAADVGLMFQVTGQVDGPRDEIFVAYCAQCDRKWQVE